MQYTKLGNSDLNVSKVCIGCKMSQIALDVTLTPEEVEYLEELYVPHFRTNCETCGSKLICNGCSDCGKCL